MKPVRVDPLPRAPFRVPLVYRLASNRTWTECFSRALAEIALEHVDDPEE